MFAVPGIHGSKQAKSERVAWEQGFFTNKSLAMRPGEKTHHPHNASAFSGGFYGWR